MKFKIVGFLGFLALTLTGFVSYVSAQNTQSLPFVHLQPGSPGYTQAGNLHISGAALAGSFEGDGSGVTNVNANLLDGLDSTAFLQGIPFPLVVSGASTSTAIKGSNSGTGASMIGVQGEVTNTAATGTSYGGFFTAVDDLGVGVFGRASGTSGKGVYGHAAAVSGSTYGGYFTCTSPSGIGVYSSTGGSYGVHAESTKTSGVAYGGWFETASTDGYGIVGVASANSGPNVGGSFLCYGTTGTAIRGIASATTGQSDGAYLEVAGPSSYGVYCWQKAGSGTNFAGYFLADSDFAIACYGRSTATSGSTRGGAFSCESTAGRAVSANAGAGTGTTYGGYFTSDSVSGRGLFGWATSTTAGSTPYGVIGQCSTATSGFAVFASGDMGATGVKPFRIDHPIDPENKYLLHYASESPFPQNFYNGNVTTDDSGYAWVKLPDYFAEINANYKYQLTVIDEGDHDEFICAKVVQKIRGNKFRIRTNLPNIEVSWEVKADRNDQRIRSIRPTDVQEKLAEEKGKYQNPEYFGARADQGLFFEAPDSRDHGVARKPGRN